MHVLHAMSHDKNQKRNPTSDSSSSSSSKSLETAEDEDERNASDQHGFEDEQSVGCSSDQNKPDKHYYCVQNGEQQAEKSRQGMPDEKAFSGNKWKVKGNQVIADPRKCK